MHLAGGVVEHFLRWGWDTRDYCTGTSYGRLLNRRQVTIHTIAVELRIQVCEIRECTQARERRPKEPPEEAGKPHKPPTLPSPSPCHSNPSKPRNSLQAFYTIKSSPQHPKKTLSLNQTPNQPKRLPNPTPTSPLLQPGH